MSKLNCSVGDLAITVFCNLPENQGNIVRIKSAVGPKGWGCTESWSSPRQISATYYAPKRLLNG